MIGELIPIILFICIAIVIWAYFHFATKTKKEQLQTVQKVIDSGQNLSPELIASIAKPAPSDRTKDFSRGILFIAFAIAFFIFGALGIDHNDKVMWISVFPFSIGVAYLLIFKFRPTES